eukprot:gene6310-8369_t
MSTTNSLDVLIQALRRLPGVGVKSAQRMAFHLLQHDREGALSLSRALAEAVGTALREVLGSHVQQKGSLVDADKTRFDFTHNAPVTDAQIREIEAAVNAEILANAATDA